MLFGYNADNLKIARSHLLPAHSATHALSFENARRIARCSDRSWSALTIGLTVSLLPDAAKMMTFYNTLKIPSLRSCHDMNRITYVKDIAGCNLCAGIPACKLLIVKRTNLLYITERSRT